MSSACQFNNVNINGIISRRINFIIYYKHIFSIYIYIIDGYYFFKIRK